MTRIALAAVPLMALRTCMAQPVDTSPVDTGLVDSAEPSGDGGDGGPGGDEGGGGGGDGGDGGQDTEEPCAGEGQGVLEIQNESFETITLLLSVDCDGTMETKTLLEPLQGNRSMLIELQPGLWDWIAMVENRCASTRVEIEDGETTSWEITELTGEVTSTADGWGCE